MPDAYRQESWLGGDYDGCYPTDAEGAFNHVRFAFNPAFLDRIAWFVPFVERIAWKQDFSLDDLKFERRRARVISGP